MNTETGDKRIPSQALTTRQPSLLNHFPKLAALITLFIGGVVLLGWAFTIPLLKSVLPGAVEMKANTALGLVFSAISLWLLSDQPSRGKKFVGVLFAAAVLILGIATLGEYLFAWHLGIDELLFLDKADAFNVIPGRMSPYSTIVFALTGIALAALPWRPLKSLMWLTSIVVIAIGMVSFLGYLWNASELVTDHVLPPVAVNTAVAFILIGLGIFRAGWATRQRVLRTPMEMKIIASFFGTFVVLVLMGGFTYRTGVAYEQSAKQVGDTQIIRSKLGDLYGTVSDIESGQRSYLLTGKHKYKTQYQHDIAQLYIDRKMLEDLVADHIEQTNNLATLWPLIDHRIGLLERHSTIFEENGLPAASQAIANNDGNSTMQQIRQLTSHMDSVELDLLADREIAMAQKRQITLVALLATLAMATAILALLFIGIRREIIARAKAEEKTQSIATRISTILDTVVDGIITTNDKGIIETFNPAAERIFGYTAEEAVGENVRILMPETEQDRHEGYIERYLSGGAPRIIGSGREENGKRKDGGVFPMELSISEMYLGKDRYFTGIVQDITDRKQAEQILVAAKERAELANRAKDSFLATMSHEIRTPLTGMLGMLELLSLSSLDKDQKSTLHVAWESGRNLLRIVSDILDWSKIEEGELQLVREATSLPQLMQDVVNTYSRVASTKNLVLWQHVDERISPAHYVDPLRLSQVLNNYVSNAIKFTQQGEVELYAALLECENGKETIQFSVKDSGIGIAKENQVHLFQRYRQETADTARMYGGTGLGLSICRRLAELMGGKVGLLSEPGKGATFCITLTLPVSDAPVAFDTLHPEVEQRAVKPLFTDGDQIPLVLAVDDHPINRDLLASQIRLLGLNVETAENGLAALSIWRSKRFDLIITDCHMPEMDGYALSRAIRAEEAAQGLPRVPLIAWTANALNDEVDRCQNAGMDEQLVKPANLGQLKKTLKKWLNPPSIAATTKDTAIQTSKPDGQNAPPIDFSVLDQIVPEHVDRIHVLDNFQNHIRTDLHSLHTVINLAKHPDIVQITHRMKGSSRMVGATELALICLSIEDAVKANDMIGVQNKAQALNDAVGRFEAYLAENRQQRPQG